MGTIGYIDTTRPIYRRNMPIVNKQEQ